MSEIPDDITQKAALIAVISGLGDRTRDVIASGILSERNRCISIAQSLDPHNEAEAHLIETIVRKMRGDE